MLCIVPIVRINTTVLFENLCFQIQVQYDIHALSDRLITPASLPLWTQFYWVNLIKSTQNDALRYTIALPDFERIWQAYRIRLTAKNCTSPLHQAVMTRCV